MTVFRGKWTPRRSSWGKRGHAQRTEQILLLSFGGRSAGWGRTWSKRPWDHGEELAQDEGITAFGHRCLHCLVSFNISKPFPAQMSPAALHSTQRSPWSAHRPPESPFRPRCWGSRSSRQRACDPPATDTALGSIGECSRHRTLHPPGAACYLITQRNPIRHSSLKQHEKCWRNASANIKNVLREEHPVPVAQ